MKKIIVVLTTLMSILIIAPFSNVNAAQDAPISLIAGQLGNMTDGDLNTFTLLPAVQSVRYDFASVKGRSFKITYSYTGRYDTTLRTYQNNGKWENHPMPKSASITSMTGNLVDGSTVDVNRFDFFVLNDNVKIYEVEIYGDTDIATPTPTPIATPTPTATPTATPTPTPIATPTPTATPTATPTPTPTATPTATPTPTPALEPTLDVAIAPEKIGVGKGFTADVSLKNVKDIYAEDFEIKYDNKLLQYLGFEEVTGYKVYNNPTDQNGSVRFVVASQGEEYGINKDTVVIKLKFKAKAIGTAVIDSTKARIADTKEEYDLKKDKCLEDSIIIEAADVNKSGQYTLLDLSIDARYFKYFAADVDPVKYNAQQAGDEYVNDDDLLFIVDQMLNNPDYQPNT